MGTFPRLAVFVILLLPSVRAEALEVLLSPHPDRTSTFTQRVFNSVLVEESETVPTLSMSYSSLFHTEDLPSSADTDIDLHSGGLMMGITHMRSVALGARARSQGTIYFSVDEDVSFVLSGSYAAPGTGPHPLTFAVTLEEVFGSQLFHNLQQSFNTPGEVFLLGEQGGDTNNELFGGLSGTLLANTEYRLNFFTQTGNPQSQAAQQQAALGTVNLSFVAATVPAQNPIGLGSLLLLLGLLATVAIGKRTLAARAVRNVI